MMNIILLLFWILGIIKIYFRFRTLKFCDAVFKNNIIEKVRKIWQGVCLCKFETDKPPIPIHKSISQYEDDDIEYDTNEFDLYLSIPKPDFDGLFCYNNFRFTYLVG